MSKTDFVNVVIESAGEYLMLKNCENYSWNFIEGKTNRTKSLKQNAVREINNKTGLNLSADSLNNFSHGDSYIHNQRRYNPVYFNLDENKKSLIGAERLSEEYYDFEWIDLSDFDEYTTEEKQYQALENLSIVNGGVTLAAVKKNGELLFVERSPENSTPGRWGFVSGGIKYGENSEEAAVRELMEETSLKAEPVETCSFYIGEAEKGYWRLEPVKMDYISGEIDLNWELSEYEWIKPKQVENHKTIGSLKGFNKLGFTT